MIDLDITTKNLERIYKELPRLDITNLEVTIKNLEKIHKELPLLAEKIPSIRHEFNMNVLGCYSSSTLSNPFCETYGCGLGHSARLFDLSKPEYYNDEGCFRYGLFSQCILPSIEVEYSLWHYLFCDEWGEVYSKFKAFEDFIERVANVVKLLKEKGVCEVYFDPAASNDFTIENELI